jgi:Lsr2 protein
MIKTKTQTEFVDDLDGTVGGSVATRTFTVGSDVRHLELSDENWDRLVAALEPWIKVSRKAPKSAVRKGRGPQQPVDAQTRAFNKAARQWATDQGLIDARRGRMSEELKQRYRDAVTAGSASAPQPVVEPERDPNQIPAF